LTAEIVIMNNNGLAMAADSAVSIGKQRVWQTANKLFSLSPHNDIGIMIYGGGDFLGHSWETLIKCYRQDLGDKQFSTIAECGKDFIKYIESDKIKDTKESISRIFFLKIHKIVNQLIKGGAKPNLKTLEVYIAGELDAVKDKEIIVKITKKKFLSGFNKIVETLIDGLLEMELEKKNFKTQFSKKSISLIKELCFESFRRRVGSTYETGIVIAGFGQKEYFPALVCYTVDGKYKNLTRVWSEPEYNVDLNDGDTAAIIPFAQKDVFDLFMQGIAPDNERFLAAALNKIFKNELSKPTLIEKYVPKSKRAALAADIESANKQLITKFLKEFQRWRQERFVDPILSVVAALPKEEMAAMAEALVELTSLRRKVDSNLQSVGGPTDVAIISKGDGLIWIKRKHYFNMDMNHDFINRKQMLQQGKGTTL
jgi:hypothetical protein